MDLASPKTIKNLLNSRGIRPSRGLGQNFLVDRGAVRKVIEAADIQSNEIVLEIGPGLGVLTRELAQKAEKVIAVEKDPKMVELLKETLCDFSNVDVIRGDILKLGFSNSKFEARNSKQAQNSNDQNSKPRLEYLNLENLNLFRISDFGLRAFKVIGNLPFYLTAPIIRKFLEGEYQPKEMVFIIQKEVAQRICSKPPDMSLLAVSVQFYAEPKIISYVSRKSFWPSPEVDAAIIKITPHVSRTVLDTLLFFEIVKAGFSQPRKQLANNLSKGLDADKTKIGGWLLKNNIQPSQRAQTLSVRDWLNLSKSFKMS